MKDLFELALGIRSPWFIDMIKMDINSCRMDITIKFKTDAKFEYVSDDKEIIEKFSHFDTILMTWKYLNFFQYECHLHCNVPLLKLKNGVIHQIRVPFSR